MDLSESNLVYSNLTNQQFDCMRAPVIKKSVVSLTLPTGRAKCGRTSAWKNMYGEELPIDSGFPERRDLWRVYGYLAAVEVEGPVQLSKLMNAVRKYL